MCPKKNWLLRYLAPAIAVLGAAIGWSSPSDAFVQQIVIDSMQTASYSPIPLGSSTPGSPVSYTIYTGRIFGALNPRLPQNAVITDIGLASPVYTTPAPPSGNATYIADFSIVTPTDPAARSGLLVYEVSNRGGSAISTTALIAGATYVQSGWQGDLLAQCSGVSSLPVSPYPCQSLSSPYGTPSTTYPFFTPPAGLTDFVVQVPVATADRKPPNGSNVITGPVYGHIKAPYSYPGTTGQTGQLVIYSTAFVPYQPSGAPSSMSTSNAQFWYDTSQSTDGVNTGMTTIPSSAWSWAYCPNGPGGAGYTPNPTWICLTDGSAFNTNYLYEMVFTAQNPLVQGVGFAATRDLVSFLRYSTTDTFGNPNPIAGTVSKAMIVGVSQSGAFTRSFTFYGFNEDESSNIVFDGDWVIISGRILFINERWAQPNVLLNLYMGGNEAPVWWADFPNVARDLPAASILDRCKESATCPQVLETWGGNEFYINKMGADFVGFCEAPPSSIACTTEIPQPANVYRYYAKGATHGGSTVSFTWSSPTSITTPFSTTQYLPTSAIPETYTNNALQYAFMGLLGCAGGTPDSPTCGNASVPMPPSVSGITYPSFDSGQLAPATNQTAVGFPNIPIPGLASFLGDNPYGGDQAWPPFVYDFGPQCPRGYPISRQNPAFYCIDYTSQSGVPTIQPPTIQKVLTPYVPTVGADGNENVGGLPTVLGQAPLGSYISWNIIPSGPYAGQAVELNAGYWPFYDTTAQASAAGDPRLSLEQRYGTNAGYQCVAQQAAIIAAANGYLLPSDETILLADISGSNVLASGYTPTTADTNLGASLCATEALAAAYYAGLNLGIDTYYAFIDVGPSKLGWNSGPIAGNVLFGQGLNARLFGGNNGEASGTVQYDHTTEISGSLQKLINKLPVPTSVTSAARTAAQNVSSYASSLPATQTFGNINNAQIIYGNGGLNVINVANIQNAQLTLSGTASDIFVINVSGGIQTSQPMTLSGVLASHVLFNLTGKSGIIFQTSGGNVLYGTYLATNGGQFNFSQLNLTGALINIGGNVQFVSGSQIPTSAPFTPFQLPEIVNVF
jgi:hypothetical protein